MLSGCASLRILVEEDGVGGIVCVQVFIAQGFRGGRGREGEEGRICFF